METSTHRQQSGTAAKPPPDSVERSDTDGRKDAQATFGQVRSGRGQRTERHMRNGNAKAPPMREPRESGDHAVPQPTRLSSTGQKAKAEGLQQRLDLRQVIRQQCREGRDESPAQWEPIERSAPIDLCAPPAVTASWTTIRRARAEGRLRSPSDRARLRR